MFEEIVVQSRVGEVCIGFMGINIGIEIGIVEHAHLIYIALLHNYAGDTLMSPYIDSQ
jgi:hypothetical protein